MPHRNLLLTKDGQRYYRRTGGGKNRSQIFNNKWQDLIERVQKNEKDFPYFSFSTLRDTAGDLVRQTADGEVSSTAAPEKLVEQPMQQYTPMNKRDRIIELNKGGMKVTQIMEEVGLSRMTVLRTLEKLYYRKKR